MKKSTVITSILVSAAVLLFTVVLTNISYTQEEEDAYPNGCISCHVNANDVDMTIPTLLAANHPKHPKVSSMKMIPDDCGKCHKKGAKYGELSELMHKTHDMESSKFKTEMNGNCTSCHIMKTEDEPESNKSAEKNW